MDNINKPLRRILVIAYVFPPIVYAGTFRTLRLCNELAKNGYEIDVLTIKSYDDLHNDPVLLENVSPAIRIIRTPLFDVRRVHRRFFSGTAKTMAGKLASRLFAMTGEFISKPDYMVYWIPHAVRAAMAQHKNRSYDLIYTSTPPHSGQFIGSMVKKRTGVPWVADLRDPLVDNFLLGRQKGVKHLIYQYLEKTLVRRADAIVFSCDAACRRFRKRYPQANVHSIRNSYDEKDFLKMLPIEKSGVFTIAHIGSIYGNRGFDIALKIIRDVVRSRSIASGSFRLMLVGLGGADIIGLVNEYGLSGYVTVVPMKPHGDALKIMMQSQVLLLLGVFGDKNDAQIPSKLFEYIGADKSILCIEPRGTETARIVQNTGKGIIAHENTKPAREWLIQRYNEHQKQEKGGVIADLPIKEEYTAHTMAIKFRKLFETLLHGPDS